jgi:prepilin-type N-terminal cleavage/methylation domain-containing protein
VVLRNRFAVTRGRRRSDDDDGFSLIEVIVALSLLVIVMLSTAGFFVQSLKLSSGQTQQQQAAQLASQQLDYTRSVPAKALLYGRTQTAVAAATAAPGLADLSQDVITAGTGGAPFNYDNWDGLNSSGGQTSQVVPISFQTPVAGVTYTLTTFVDRCYVTFGTNQQCVRNPATPDASWLYRITVDVSWKLAGGRVCLNSSSTCQFVASTLRDPGSDPCFNVNVDFAGCSVSQPVVTSVTPASVLTGSVTNMSIAGVNFDPGAKVTIDQGGTISNVVVVSPTLITYTLTAPGDDPTAVGTRTIRVTNLNGKYALGTMTISALPIDVTSVTPATGAFGSNKTFTINGSGFSSTAVVTVDGNAVSGTATWNSAAKLTVLFSAFPAVGSHSFTVTNPDGGFDSGTFTVTPGITVTSVTSSTGSFAYGNTKTFSINGTGFASGFKVTMDGATLAGTTTLNSSTKITLVLSAFPAAGPHIFTVTNTDTGTANGTFTITTGAVNISSITTSTGSFAYGNTKSFVLNGTGFVNGATVKMDSATIAGTVAYVSATKMTVAFTNYPAVGAHSFTLTNPDTGSDTEPFTIVTATFGAISGITPVSVASNASNTTFTVAGTGFVTGTGTVTLNGAPTGNTDYNLTLSVTSSTRATFVVPALPGAGTYPIIVNLNYSNGTISPDFTWTLTIK